MAADNLLTIMDDIELAGEQAYLANKEYDNPYPVYSDEFNRYERGWTQAMKKFAVGLIKPVSRKSETEFPILFKK